MYLTSRIAVARGQQDLIRQANICRQLGSPFVADVLEAAYRHLLAGPKTASVLAGWPGNPAAAALSLRLNAAFHAIARNNELASLSALYRGDHRDFDDAIAEALHLKDDVIAEWLGHPTQTNEVGRAAAFFAALVWLRARSDREFELLELGSSSGLNLNMARYGYLLGGVPAGDATSPIQLQPDWRGSPLRVAAEPVIRSARGVDLRPLDPTDAATRDRLLAYVWADQPTRIRRLERALALAREARPLVDRANATTWLRDKLRAPQEKGRARIVIHSMVMQYCSKEDRASLARTLRLAGSRATVDRPIARIGFEWTPDRRQVHLNLTSWPGGTTALLAICHPYGDWIDWRC
jgi:hypothetical protein